MDAKKTSPYKFYQYWINSTDSDAENYIKIFTLDNKEKIDGLITKHKTNPGLRDIAERTANIITMIHGEDSI